MKPTPSVLSPVSLPVEMVIVLTAPAVFAASLISSTRARGASERVVVRGSAALPAAPNGRPAVSGGPGAAQSKSQLRRRLFGRQTGQLLTYELLCATGC